MGFQIDPAQEDKYYDPQKATSLVFRSERPTDVRLNRLSDFPHLTELLLSNVRITEQDLKHIGACTGLHSLRLDRAQVVSDSDRQPIPLDLRFLDRLTALRELSFSYTPLPDNLTALAQLQQLQMLDLTATGVTAAGLKNIQRLLQLHLLRISGNTLGEEELWELRYIPSLQHLVIDSRQLSAADLQYWQLHYWREIVVSQELAVLKATDDTADEATDEAADEFVDFGEMQADSGDPQDTLPAGEID